MNVLILCAQNKDFRRLVLYRYPSRCKSFIYHFYLTGDLQLEDQRQSLYPHTECPKFYRRLPSQDCKTG